jgi:hypothetical protein
VDLTAWAVVGVVPHSLLGRGTPAGNVTFLILQLILQNKCFRYCLIFKSFTYSYCGIFRLWHHVGTNILEEYFLCPLMFWRWRQYGPLKCWYHIPDCAVKCWIFSVYAIKPYRDSRGGALLILSLGLNGLEWSTSCHGHFCLQEWTLVCTEQKAWHALLLVWCFADEENLFPQPKFKPQSVLACNLMCVPTVIPWYLVIVNLNCR